MKKMMCILATAIAALVLTGCGGKPKIPANTVVACYVDLEKCLKNGHDIAELVIDNLPKHLKGKAEDAHEKAREEFEKNLSSFDFKWLAVTVGTDGKGTEEIAAVVRCDYQEKNDDGNNLVRLVEMAMGEKCETKFDADVVFGRLPELGRCYVAFVDEEYVIVTKNLDTLEKIVRLYADGKGDTSDAFDDLTDLRTPSRASRRPTPRRSSTWPASVTISSRSASSAMTRTSSKTCSTSATSRSTSMSPTTCSAAS